jgi:hypothetical protein
MTTSYLDTSIIRQLPDQDLELLRSAVAREVRRRKRIARVNAEWTANQGLEACLQKSIDMKKGSEKP